MTPKQLERLAVIAGFEKRDKLYLKSALCDGYSYYWQKVHPVSDWNPADDNSAQWQLNAVLEGVRKRGYFVVIEQTEKLYAVEIIKLDQTGPTYAVMKESLPTAICLAALELPDD